jgi:hypothetical protein
MHPPGAPAVAPHTAPAAVTVSHRSRSAATGLGATIADSVSVNRRYCGARRRAQNALFWLAVGASCPSRQKRITGGCSRNLVIDCCWRGYGLAYLAAAALAAGQ